MTFLVSLPASRTRVLVAMSGGVDSSVAAAMLVDAGHEVIGVTLHLWNAEGHHKVGRCCAPEDQEDARRTCDHLGIPHYVIDERESFRRQVVEPLIEEYLNGRTPSPCVHCNRTVKLTYLETLADRFGTTHIATGHYARIVIADGGHATLLRGRDYTKDQSYFLFGVGQLLLRRLVFPLGDMAKNESRELARRFGLPNAEKPDSQELCFIPDGDVRGFIERERGTASRGTVRTEAGEVLGAHDGITGFTVGQRRGIGLGGGPARYVLRIIPDQNEVVVGDADRLLGDALAASDTHWIQARPWEPFTGNVRIRYRHEPAAAEIIPTATGFTARFEKAQRAITPGQAAVIYKGEEVIGGGFIA